MCSKISLKNIVYQKCSERFLYFEYKANLTYILTFLLLLSLIDRRISCMTLGLINRVAIFVLHCIIYSLALLIVINVAFFDINCMSSFSTFGFMRCVTFFLIADIITDVIIRVAFLVIMVITSLKSEKNPFKSFYLKSAYSKSVEKRC